jgi:hypothetical protein
MTCATQRKKEAHVSVDGKFLTRSPQAIKLRTVYGDEWIPLSLISESDAELDELEEGDEVMIEIPKWLAREKGWVE